MATTIGDFEAEYIDVKQTRRECGGNIGVMLNRLTHIRFEEASVTPEEIE